MQFWLRRDPTPDTEENELKEEHYRRIAFSNEHFAARTMGSLTDRGRIYIKYGPPDAITRQPGTGTPEPPKQVWHFESFSTTGGPVMWQGKQPRDLNRVDLVFVDNCRCNDYRLQTPEPK
jgi:GWxTD domain-containing protein